MNKWLIFGSGLFTLALVSCVTPYQPLNSNGGYSDMQLNKTTYKVFAQGNGFTTSQQVEAIAMRRCAELTLQNGYKYFIIADKNTKVETTRSNNQPSSTTYASKDFITGEPVYHTYYHNDTLEYQQVTTTITIKMTNDYSGKVVDAHLILMQTAS
jgi:hypothetical protein